MKIATVVIIGVIMTLGLVLADFGYGAGYYPIYTGGYSGSGGGGLGLLLPLVLILILFPILFNQGSFSTVRVINVTSG